MADSKRRIQMDSAHVDHPVHSMMIDGSHGYWVSTEIGPVSIWSYTPEQAEELAEEFARVAQMLRDKAREKARAAEGGGS